MIPGAATDARLAGGLPDETPRREADRIDRLPPDESRGSMAMALTIVTEALLFACFFFAYFYVGHRHPIWPPEPPKIRLALIMLAVLLTSSGTLYVAEHCLKAKRYVVARLLVLVTLALGAGFLVIQTAEYRKHLRELRPTDDAYGSLFYVMTSFHGLHVLVGLLMLAFVACLPRLDTEESPHRPLHNASLYWHFVDVVWVFIVGLIYLLPRAAR